MIQIKKLFSKNFYPVMVLVCYIFSYLCFYVFNLSLYGLATFMLSTYFTATHFYLNRNKYSTFLLLSVHLVITILLNIKIFNIYNIHYHLNQIWFLLMFINIPYIIILLFDKIIIRHPYILHILNPIDEFEIEREDNIIIDIVGIFQAMLLINFSFKESSAFQLYTIVALLLFTIPRFIGIIRNSNTLRWLSSVILVAVLLIDIFIIIYESPPITNFIIYISNVFKITLDLAPFIFYVYFVTILSVTVAGIVRNRYAKFEEKKEKIEGDEKMNNNSVKIKADIKLRGKSNLSNQNNKINNFQKMQIILLIINVLLIYQNYTITKNNMEINKQWIDYQTQFTNYEPYLDMKEMLIELDNKNIAQNISDSVLLNSKISFTVSIITPKESVFRLSLLNFSSEVNKLNHTFEYENQVELIDPYVEELPSGLSKFIFDAFLQGRFRPNERDRPEPGTSRGWIVGRIFFEAELTIIPTGQIITEVFDFPLMITIYND